MTLISRPRLAVLIDAENASAAQACLVMDKAAALGRPTVRRAYGDWTQAAAHAVEARGPCAGHPAAPAVPFAF